MLFDGVVELTVKKVQAWPLLGSPHEQPYR